MTDTEIVRAVFNAYRAQDRAAVEPLLADVLRFTSPQDDRIDRAAYLERCFPTASRFRSQEIRRLVATGDGGVFLLYEYELMTGGRYRNTEFLTVLDGQVVEIQVFFGGRAA